MSAARPAAPAADIELPTADDELLAWLEERLGRRVEALVRHPLAEATSFACERLTVTADGGTRELFFKDYGRCRLPRADSDGARREVLAYRRLLDGARLGTAAHLGSRLQPEDLRSWLLLESVPGSRLADSGWRHWLDAAAWLGRLQALGAERGLARDPPDWLVRHDLTELRATVEEAVREVAAVDLGAERALQDALDGYESLVELLAEQPPVLVHGSFRPENILVDVPGEPGRVVPVDWEHAALGGALSDVSVLSAGLGRARAEQLLAAQRAAAAAHGLRLPAGDEAWELVTLLRLHKLLRSLGRARRWSYGRDAIERSIAYAGRLRLELAAAGGRGRPAAAPRHPAVRSWHAAGGVEAIAAVSQLRGRFFGRKGRVVYRLSAEGGASIVGKRSRRAALAVEHLLYADVLPRLPAAAPRCLGFVADGAAHWLFLEDAGDTRLDPADARQRAGAARLLGGLHAAAARLPRDERLPDWSARRFLELLAESRAAMVAGLDHPALDADRRARLQDVVAVLTRLASRWDRIASGCDAAPPTLVHGDFRPKNLLVRHGAQGLAIRIIDWEYAGWGVAALDLGALLRDRCTRADLQAYREGLGPGARSESLERLAAAVRLGRVLRALVSMHWASTRLSSAPARPVDDLCVFAAALSAALAEIEA